MSESDLEWGRAKYVRDEEGVAALRMKKKLLEEYKSQLCYEHSERYAEWADAVPDSLGWNPFEKGGWLGVVVYSQSPIL